MFGLRSKKTDETAAEGGFLARLKAKLNKGTSWVADLLPGRKIDDEVLEELETRLLAADLGVEATQAILADLHRRVALIGQGKECTRRGAVYAIINHQQRESEMIKYTCE